jgi:hypothetical protein
MTAFAICKEHCQTCLMRGRSDDVQTREIKQSRFVPAKDAGYKDERVGPLDDTADPPTLRRKDVNTPCLAIYAMPYRSPSFNLGC